MQARTQTRGREPLSDPVDGQGALPQMSLDLRPPPPETGQPLCREVRDPATVVERCRAKHGGYVGSRCITIFNALLEPTRFEDCRDWCPLLREVIE